MRFLNSKLLFMFRHRRRRLTKKIDFNRQKKIENRIHD